MSSVCFFCCVIRLTLRSLPVYSSAASDVYKRQLYYLIIITFVASLAWSMKRPADDGTSSPFVSNGMLIGLVLALVPIRMICNQLDGGMIRIAESYTDIKFGGFIYFAICFLAGTALYARRELLTPLSQRKTLLILGILAIMAFVRHLIMLMAFSDIEDPQT